MALMRLFEIVLVVSVLFTFIAAEVTSLDNEINGFLSTQLSSSSVIRTLQNVPASEQRTIKREELKAHLLQKTHEQTDVYKPSTGFMIDLFENLLEGQEMPTILGHTDKQTRDRILHSDTIRSFTAKQLGEADFMFQVPELPDHEHLEMVELRFLDNRRLRRRHRLTLRVQKDADTLVIQKVYYTSDSKSHSLSPGAVSVINQYKGNISIKLTMRKSDLNRRDGESSDVAPILVIYSTDQGFLRSALKSVTSNSGSTDSDNVFTHRIQKRAADSKNKSRKKGRKRRKDRWRKTEICQALDFKVDFDLIGWGPWIIHPKTYNARVCYGQCPSPIGSEYTPTNHAMLQTLMRMKRPLSAPEPCCVPTKLRPLSMLYFEYDDIVVRHHQDMVVDKCGCR